MSDGTTLLFGLPGVRVERVERLADGTRVVHVATAEETAAACPSCGVVSTSVKARVTTSPRDIPYGEDRIVVRWNKTRWRCREDYCERSSFTEAIAQVPARARTTRRLRTQIGAAIGDAARSVAEVAAGHRVSWPTAHRAFVAHAEAVLGEPQPTPVLGIDETRRGKPRWERCAATGRWVRVDPWDTGFVDLAGDQGLLGQREGRTGAAVIDWLSERAPAFRDGRRVRGDRPGRGLRLGDPHARAAAQRDDRGRSLPSGQARQRRAHQGAPPRHLGPARSPRPHASTRSGPTGADCCVLGNACRTRASPRCGTPIMAEDDTGQILSAWIAKEELRTLLSTVRVGGDPHLTRHRLHRFLSWCIDSQIPELLTLAATIDTWWPEINAFVPTGITNARTEG